jgi:hypothetical protein
MSGRNRTSKDMPDVPDMDFVDSICEIFSGVNFAAYHLCYVRVYTQTGALQTEVAVLRKQEQTTTNRAQADVFICRAHLAAFFWQLQHVFESIGTAVTRGQKEHPDKTYFWLYEKRLEELKQSPIGQEITAYRNMSHENPAIIGCHWESKGGKFQFHFLPVLSGYESRALIELNAHLRQFFEFVVNVWFEFVPSHYAKKFPRDFKFPVTVPNTFTGELPPELKDLRQLEVELRANPSTEGESPGGTSRDSFSS